MPRRPRVFVEGGIYRVYNRVIRGEAVFAEDSEFKENPRRVGGGL